MATVVAFHAHPDDEVVLTGGTLARAAATGHRVVLVTATDGRMWDKDDSCRLDELRSSAGILGVHRAECLGYADSGYGPEFYPDPPGRVRFGRADREEAAQRLATILRDEDADLLLSYQRNGGYGHRDHVQVHHVGKRAAELAATPRVLEVTMPRELLRRTSDLAHLLRLPAPYDPDIVRTAYAPRATITIGLTSSALRARSEMRSPPTALKSATPAWPRACSRSCSDYHLKHSAYCSAESGSSIRHCLREPCAATSLTDSPSAARVSVGGRG